MKKKRPNKILIVYALLGISIIFTAGCDKHTKYKVLTFFFTGVPPLEQEKKDWEKEGKKEVIAKAEDKKKTTEPQGLAFLHGPYGAGQCYQCHDITTTASFKRFGVEKSQVTTMRRQGVQGRLVTPLKKLCTECHPQKSAESAYSKNLWSHGPAADGSCTVCHNPHRTQFRYMLLKEKTTELCSQCHSSGYIRETEEHMKGRECTSCHNPHMGRNNLLLKKDFNEVF